MDDLEFPWDFLVFLSACSLALFALLFTAQSCDPKNCFRTVDAVGGCDKYGMCGVRFKDGSFGEASRPVIGESIRSYCKEK